MDKLQLIASFCKKPAFILGLILISFFLKEMFLSALLPMFSGVDEYRHYNTIQYLSEPKEKNWAMEEMSRKKFTRSDFKSNHFSEEILQTGQMIDIEKIWSGKSTFTYGYVGVNENEINSRKWDPYNKVFPPDVVKGAGIYHQLLVYVEKFFANNSILVRFYLIRTISIIFGTLTILVAYFLFKNADFSRKNSLILAAIFSLQPRFSIYTTNINYDSLLILIFTFFALGGVLFLKQGINWKNGSLLLLSFAAGMFTKGTSIVLIIPFLTLIAFFIYQKIKEGKVNLKDMIIFLLAPAIIMGIFFLKYNFEVLAAPENSDLSFTTFLSRSLHRIRATSTDYWGAISWTRVNFSSEFAKIIWLTEALAVVGIVFFLVSKKNPEFLLKKKYIFFFCILMLALQTGIRFNNWRITASGSELLYGTPGRYFIPALAAHLAVMFCGLGAILRKQKYFDNFLLAALVFMLAFSLHIIFNVVLPRFYL